MFRLLKKYGVGDPYSSSRGPPGEAITLDPLEKGIAGRASISNFGLAPFLFVMCAVAVLGDTSIFFRDGVIPNVRWTQKARPEYDPHFGELEECGILKKTEAGKIRFLSGYFARGKNGDPRRGRAIFSGKGLSKVTDVPPTVNLPEIPEMLILISQLYDKLNQGRKANRHVRPHVLTADIRHWFHQIGMNSVMWPYFAVCDSHGQYYNWTTLPMGWSYSPRIAQCMCWTILLTKRVAKWIGVEHCLEEMRVAPNPPSYTYMKDKNGATIGIMFIWYDNVTAIVFDATIVYELRRNMVASAAHYNVKWKGEKGKEIEIFGPNGILYDKISDKAANFLGIQLAVRKDEIVWRHMKSKIPTFGEVATLLRRIHPTSREVARGLGYLVWDKYISAKPLCTLAFFLDLSAKNSCGPQDWDKITKLSTDQVRAVADRLESIEREHQWHTSHAVEGDIEHLACDSSDDYEGNVLFNPDGSFSDQNVFRRKWDVNIAKTHIYFKELLAAIRAIESLLDRRPSVKVIYVAIDNTAAAHALRRMYSTNASALERIIRLSERLEQANVRLHVVSVRGIDNLADCPTRSRPPRADEKKWNAWMQQMETRRRATRTQIEAFKRGSTRVDDVVDKYRKTPRSSETDSSRHDEPPDVMVDLSKDICRIDIPDS